MRSAQNLEIGTKHQTKQISSQTNEKPELTYVPTLTKKRQTKVNPLKTSNLTPKLVKRYRCVSGQGWCVPGTNSSFHIDPVLSVRFLNRLFVDVFQEVFQRDALWRSKNCLWPDTICTVSRWKLLFLRFYLWKVRKYNFINCFV